MILPKLRHLTQQGDFCALHTQVYIDKTGKWALLTETEQDVHCTVWRTCVPSVCHLPTRCFICKYHFFAVQVNAFLDLVGNPLIPLVHTFEIFDNAPILHLHLHSCPSNRKAANQGKVHLACAFSKGWLPYCFWRFAFCMFLHAQ